LFLIPPANFKTKYFYTGQKSGKNKKPRPVSNANAYTDTAKNLVWTLAFATNNKILNFKIFPSEMGFID
jgi:hypothetical protein